MPSPRLRPAVAVAVALVVASALLTGCRPEPVPAVTFSAPGSMRSPSPTPSATVDAVPSPTPTLAEVVITCDAVLSAAGRAELTARGWSLRETTDPDTPSGPFADFPNGLPPGQIGCRAEGTPAAPDGIDLGWAQLDSETAIAAMQQLGARGYVRSDTSEGALYTAPGSGGAAYLFTPFDVRWASTSAAIGWLTTP